MGSAHISRVSQLAAQQTLLLLLLLLLLLGVG